VSGPAILIAPAELLPALSARVDGTPGLQTFSDADALRALETITRTRPALVMLERRFSSTPRGAALVARIKADPSLNDTEVRVVPPEGESIAALVTASATQAMTMPRAQAAAPPQAAAPGLDRRGTRRAPRYRVNTGVDVTVDGTRVNLVDISTLGAQILSQSVLKPNQRVRISLADPEGTLRYGATVVWASFEIPKGSGARYRAGVEFVDPDVRGLDALAQRHKQEG
jgi:hypothetical protein